MTEESEYTESDNDNDEDNISENYDEYYETNNFINTFYNKILYFTATQKNSNGIIMYESITNFDKYELIEDDESIIKDDPDCGKMIYEYMHLNSVNDNILNDFNIRIYLYTDNIDSNVFEVF